MKEKSDKTELTLDKLDEIKKFIKPNPTAIFDLASISGLTPQQINELVNGEQKKEEEVPTVMIDFLNFAMEDMLREKAAEIVMRNKMM